MFSLYRQIALICLLLFLLIGCVSNDGIAEVQSTSRPTVSPVPTTTFTEPTATPTIKPTSIPTVEPTDVLATVVASAEPTTVVEPTDIPEPTDVPTEPTPPANLQRLGDNRYFNPLYEVGLQMQGDWMISRHSSEHHFDIRKEGYRLVILVSDENGDFVYPTGGLGAGSLAIDETVEALTILEQTVVHRYLTFEDERRRLFYTAPDDEMFFEANNRRFHISFAKDDEADLTTDADRIAIAEIDQIVQTLFVEPTMMNTFDVSTLNCTVPLDITALFGEESSFYTLLIHYE